MFKEDDKEVEEIMGRVCSYLTRVMFDDFAQSIKEPSEAFKHLKENGFKKTLIAIPLEESK
ncbi:hypothetical protein [uncultured Methanobrevibacter sp.]|uniref:hypothetical protein n=1 Tax=uncultured Methanobrevibacter sp. TaxID=253161 RepID=UPI0025EE5749|nr:hypothetical protein [uncultured Methanobrevibacter sp.]